MELPTQAKLQNQSLHRAELTKRYLQVEACQKPFLYEYGPVVT